MELNNSTTRQKFLAVRMRPDKSSGCFDSRSWQKRTVSRPLVFRRIDSRWETSIVHVFKSIWSVRGPGQVRASGEGPGLSIVDISEELVSKTRSNTMGFVRLVRNR